LGEFSKYIGHKIVHYIWGNFQNTLDTKLFNIFKKISKYVPTEKCRQWLDWIAKLCQIKKKTGLSTVNSHLEKSTSRDQVYWINSSTCQGLFEANYALLFEDHSSLFSANNKKFKPFLPKSTLYSSYISHCPALLLLFSSKLNPFKDFF
jgi:hypothetical protein